MNLSDERIGWNDLSLLHHANAFALLRQRTLLVAISFPTMTVAVPFPS